MRYFTVKTSLSTDVGGLVQQCIKSISERKINNLYHAKIQSYTKVFE